MQCRQQEIQGSGGNGARPPQDEPASPWPKEDEGFAERLIRYKASRLVTGAGVRLSDREDIEQQLRMELLSSLPQFNRAKAPWPAFATSVVSHAATKIVRDERAQKRNPARTVSLHVTVPVPDEAQDPAQLISEDDAAPPGTTRLDHVRHTDLRLDLEAVTKEMSSPWRHLLRLRATHTMSDAADEMGVPRTTLSDWTRHIRRRFEQAGLAEYLHE